MMATSSSAKSVSLFLLLNAFIRLQGVAAGRAATPSSYQPTTGGVEERWVAEEEFHGASSSSAESAQRRRIGEKLKKRGKEPQQLPSSFPGHESFGEASWWDDDDEELDEERLRMALSPSTIEEGKGASSKKRHRLRVWKNSKMRKGGQPSSTSDDHSSTSASSSSKARVSNESASAEAASEYDEEHPMRTDEWQLDVHLSRLFPKEEGNLFPECYADEATPAQRYRDGSYRKRQVMQFARNGYVKVLEDGERGEASGGGHNRKKPKVGKWRIGHSGVAFDIPVTMNVRRKAKGGAGGEDDVQSRVTVLHYHADIHLNKFGERPRMFRGVITRDR